MQTVLPRIPDLARHLCKLVEAIPAGQVTTFGRLAEALGDKTASRWVGRLLKREGQTLQGAHRVARVDGSLSEQATWKVPLLRSEGIEVANNQVATAFITWQPVDKSQPLAKLSDAQSRLKSLVRLSRRTRLPDVIAGVDVSYPSSDRAVAAYVAVETDTGHVVSTHTIDCPVEFPYITGYLAFRELPVLLALIKKVRKSETPADVVLVDGSGALHPRGAGIACHLGVLTDLVTIGVTKKKLCGEMPQEPSVPLRPVPVLIDNRPRGIAVLSPSGSARPLYFSPGHRCDVAFTEQIALATLTTRRLPEPIHHADRLSRREGKKLP